MNQVTVNTVNISGDVNILLPHKPEAGDGSVLGVVELVSTDDSPDECFLIDPGANDTEDGYDESEVSVLFLAPGKAPEVLDLIEALERMQKTGGCNAVRRVPTYDLMMAYDEDSVIPIGKEEYLFHPVIVFTSIGGELLNIRSGDIRTVQRIMEERTVQLSNGTDEFRAFLL